jgi:hypothetical protein
MLTETLSAEHTLRRVRQRRFVKAMRLTKSSLTNHMVKNICIILISLFTKVMPPVKRVVRVGKCGTVSIMTMMQMRMKIAEPVPNMEALQKSEMFGGPETHSGNSTLGLFTKIGPANIGSLKNRKELQLGLTILSIYRAIAN